MDRGEILLIDDDVELCALLTDYLGRDGFHVTTAGDGREGLERARSGRHDLVLLDIMLPDMDGLAVVRELRQTSNLPVIMLTAKGEDIDRVVGLELGADDYLPKPFNPRELAARIKAVLRRFHAGPSALARQAEVEILRSGALLLDLAGYSAQLDGQSLALTTVEFGLLKELMLSAGRALSRDALLDRVRGKEFELFDRSIDVHISHLRQKLGDDPAQPRYIRTVRSVGYTFIGAVE